MRIMGIAADAVQQQANRLESSAARVAKIGQQPARGPAKGEKAPDIAEEAVVRIEASAATEANLAVIRSEDERIGHLLDVLA